MCFKSILNALFACFHMNSLFCRCEGTAEYKYSDAVSKEFEYGVGSQDGNKQVVDKLPEEMPFPTPFVGKIFYTYTSYLKYNYHPVSVFTK